MTIQTVPVALGARSYEVRIGQGLIDRAGAEIAPLLKRKRVAIVTENRDEALRLGLHRFGRDYAADQAELVGALGVDEAPGQHVLGRHRRAHHTRQEIADADVTGGQADADEGGVHAGLHLRHHRKEGVCPYAVALGVPLFVVVYHDAVAVNGPPHALFP